MKEIGIFYKKPCVVNFVSNEKINSYKKFEKVIAKHVSIEELKNICWDFINNMNDTEQIIEKRLNNIILYFNIKKEKINITFVETK